MFPLLQLEIQVENQLDLKVKLNKSYHTVDEENGWFCRQSVGHFVTTK